MNRLDACLSTFKILFAVRMFGFNIQKIMNINTSIPTNVICWVIVLTRDKKDGLDALPTTLFNSAFILDSILTFQRFSPLLIIMY